MKRILQCVAIGLFVLTASCRAIPQQEPVKIVDTTAERVAERSPMQADLDDFASTFAFFDENEKAVAEYKTAILDFVACIEEDAGHLELIAELTSGQKGASQWTILSFFIVFSQFEFTEASTDDGEESSELEVYESLLSAIEFCEEQKEQEEQAGQERSPSRRESNL